MALGWLTVVFAPNLYFLGFYVFIDYVLIFLTRIDMAIHLQTLYVNT